MGVFSVNHRKAEPANLPLDLKDVCGFQCLKSHLRKTQGWTKVILVHAQFYGITWLNKTSSITSAREYSMCKLNWLSRAAGFSRALSGGRSQVSLPPLRLLWSAAWVSTQHSATHPAGTKSSLSISSRASCWKVTSPWLSGHIHLLNSIQFRNHFSPVTAFQLVRQTNR